jgi:hypothetical protein
MFEHENISCKSICSLPAEHQNELIEVPVRLLISIMLSEISTNRNHPKAFFTNLIHTYPNFAGYVQK